MTIIDKLCAARVLKARIANAYMVGDATAVKTKRLKTGEVSQVFQTIIADILASLYAQFLELRHICQRCQAFVGDLSAG